MTFVRCLALSLFCIFVGLFAAPREASATACTAGCVQYGTGSSFSGTTVSVTLAGVAAGNGVHVFYCLSGPTAIASVTVGGSAATVGGTTATGSGNLCGVAAFANATGGSTAVVVNTTGTCSNCNVWADEWAGDATTSLLDGQSAAYVAGSSSTPLPCGSISPANSGDTIEAVVYQLQGVAPTNPSGYSSAYTSATAFYSSYKTSAASGSQNPTFTSGASSFDNLVMCAAFKQSGGGGGGTGGRLMLIGVGK